MTITPKAVWMLGAAVVWAAVLVSSPAAAMAGSRHKDAAKAAERIIKARRKAYEAAEKQRRKTAEAAAEAWKDAAKDVAKARRKAAEAEERAARERRKTAQALRRASSRRTVVVTSGRRYSGCGPGPTFSFGRSGRRARIGVNFGLAGSCCAAGPRRWVPGGYQIRYERVCVEPARHEWRIQRVEVSSGYYQTHYVPPVVEVLYDFRGKAHKIVVEPGRTEQVWVPPRYETRRVKVWVTARYETRQTRVWVPGYWVAGPSCTHGRSGLTLSGLFRF